MIPPCRPCGGHLLQAFLESDDRVTSFPITILARCRVLPNAGFREGCAQVINTLPGLYPCPFGLAYESTLAIVLNDAFCRFSSLTHGELARRDSLLDSE